MKLSQARLRIVLANELPARIEVMVGAAIVATITLEELRRTAVMVDEMEVRAKYVAKMPEKFFP